MPIKPLSDAEFFLKLNELPSLHILKAKLEYLKSIDKNALSVKQINDVFFENVTILPYFFAPIPPDVITLLNVYRVRTARSMDLNVDDLSLIRTFSYPNPGFCMENGRANIKNKPVFYCSDNKETALAEMYLNKGDTAYLSAWKIRCDRDAIYAAFLSPSIPSKNIWYKRALDLNRQIIEFAKLHGNDKSEHLYCIYDFFADIFTSESKPYFLTSWISNDMIYQSQFADFILYPSFATNHYSCNIAFHPNFVDKYLKLDKVFKLTIQDRKDSSIHFTVLEIGEITQSAINWRYPNDKDIEWYFKGAKKII